MMRRFSLLAGLLALVLAAPVMAQQDTPQVEVTGAYQYVRLAGFINRNMQGFNGQLAANFNDWLGLVGEVTGTYQHSGVFDANVYTFMAGPRVTYRKEERATPFAHVLFGVTHISNGGSDTVFSTAVGGGMDFKVTERFAIRAGQLDWYLTKFANDTQSNFRFSAGVTIRIGKK